MKIRKNKLLFFIVFVIIIKFVSSFLMTDVLYRERTLSGEEWISVSSVSGIEKKGNTVRTLNTDPQVYLNYRDFDFPLSVRSVSFVIDDMSIDESNMDIFALDEVSNYGAYSSTSSEIRQGKNDVLLLDSNYDTDALRIDFTSSPDVDITVDSVIINDRDVIKELAGEDYMVFLYFALCVFFGIIFINAGRRRLFLGARECVFGLFAALVSAVFPYASDNDILVKCAVLVFVSPLLCQLTAYISSAVEKLIQRCGRVFKNINVGGILFSMFLCIDFLFTLILRLDVHIYILLCMLYVFGYFGEELNLGKKKTVISLLLTAIGAVIMLNRGMEFYAKAYSLENVGFGAFIILSDMVIGMTAALAQSGIKFKSFFSFLEKKRLCTCREERYYTFGSECGETIYRNILRFVFITFAFMASEIFVRCCVENGKPFVGFNYALIFMSGEVFYFNLLLVFTVSCLLYGIMGRRSSACFMVIVWALYIIGSFLKLKFHDTMLQAIDILLIKEIVLIADSYIGKTAFYAIIAFLIVLALVILINIVKIIKFLKPKFYFAKTVFMILCFVQLMYILNNNMLKDQGADFANLWINEESKFKKEGTALYAYANIKALLQLYPGEPENYSEEYMDSLEASFEKPTGESDIKPDVIMVMAESYFDINSVEEIKLSEDVVYPYRKYGSGNIISPRYGGGTAAVEFEALTGFSSMFLLKDVIPYTTYIRNAGDKFPSIAWEFDNNGYDTIVMHPNIPDFYNRDVAYEAMGFKEYLSISSFDKTNNVLRDGCFKDVPFGRKIIELAKDDSKPQFIFGITIEGHSPYEKKYNEDEMDIDVSADVDKEQLMQIRQFSQSVKETSNMIEELIEYVDSAERPTLLYVFGDHLPPIDSLGEMAVSKDVRRRYATPLITYSNYKKIDTGSDKISPVHLSAQALYDAGVEHSSYFDFIHSVKQSYPILHNDFNIDREAEDIKKYEMIQYDMMFGEKYLWNIENE